MLSSAFLKTAWNRPTAALQHTYSTGSLMWFPQQFTRFTTNGSNLHSASVTSLSKSVHS